MNIENALYKVIIIIIFNLKRYRESSPCGLSQAKTP